jgi:hypothetical protein
MGSSAQGWGEGSTGALKGATSDLVLGRSAHQMHMGKGGADYGAVVVGAGGALPQTVQAGAEGEEA